MAIHLHAPEDLLNLVGTTMGETDWHKIDQEQVDTFAEATGDRQWIHVDSNRASAGPFGTTVVHGFLTLALLPQFLDETVKVDNVTVTVNYGLNKVRFPTVVPVGASLRARVELADARTRATGVEATFTVTTELPDSPRPACVAEMIVVYR